MQEKIVKNSDKQRESVELYLKQLGNIVYEQML